MTSNGKKFKLIKEYEAKRAVIASFAISKTGN
jgi:hypothetical protein